MSYLNMDLSLQKKFRITERFSIEFQFVGTNLLNHTQFFDPLLHLTTPTAFGALNMLKGTTSGNLSDHVVSRAREAAA